MGQTSCPCTRAERAGEKVAIHAEIRPSARRPAGPPVPSAPVQQLPRDRVEEALGGLQIGVPDVPDGAGCESKTPSGAAMLMPPALLASGTGSNSLPGLNSMPPSAMASANSTASLTAWDLSAQRSRMGSPMVSPMGAMPGAMLQAHGSTSTIWQATPSVTSDMAAAYPMWQTSPSLASDFSSARLADMQAQASRSAMLLQNDQSMPPSRMM